MLGAQSGVSRSRVGRRKLSFVEGLPSVIPLTGLHGVRTRGAALGFSPSPSLGQRTLLAPHRHGATGQPYPERSPRSSAVHGAGPTCRHRQTSRGECGANRDGHRKLPWLSGVRIRRLRQGQGGACGTVVCAAWSAAGALSAADLSLGKLGDKLMVQGFRAAGATVHSTVWPRSSRYARLA